jgi:hypothetical protein
VPIRWYGHATCAPTQTSPAPTPASSRKASLLLDKHANRSDYSHADVAPATSIFSHIPAREYLPDSTTACKINAEETLWAWAPQGPQRQSKLALNHLATSNLADFSLQIAVAIAEVATAEVTAAVFNSTFAFDITIFHDTAVTFDTTVAPDTTVASDSSTAFDAPTATWDRVYRATTEWTTTIDHPSSATLLWSSPHIALSRYLPNVPS